MLATSWSPSPPSPHLVLLQVVVVNNRHDALFLLHLKGRNANNA
jgi:hypothetical protein